MAESTRERLASMRAASQVSAPSVKDLAPSQIAAVSIGFLLMLVLVAVAWPLVAFLCLNLVGNLGLSFAQIVGIGWFAAAIANQ